jgi:uncharacterized protein
MKLRKENITRLFFATDIHGSERCWRKLVNAGPFFEADAVVLSGGILGLGLQMIVREASGGWVTDFMGETLRVADGDALGGLEEKIRAAGRYPHRVSADEAAELSASPERRQSVFRSLAVRSLEGWVALAEAKLKPVGRRIIVTPGGGDSSLVGDIFRQTSVITWAERRTVWLDDLHPMICEGATGPVPWAGAGEMDEERLFQLLREQIKQVESPSEAIFNFHAPPFGSGLDDAPIDSGGSVRLEWGPGYGGCRFMSIGSRAVRKAIEIYQPLLGLHGLAYGAQGAVRVGRTVCLNPGSTYAEGVLSGYLVTLDPRGVRDFQPIRG